MNDQIKTVIAGKKGLYKRLKRRILNSKLLDKLDAFIDALQAKLQSSIHFSQFEYYRKISKNDLIHPLLLNGIWPYQKLF